MERQTILGAGGVIGKELAKVLPLYTNQIRLVNRHPEKVNPDDELFSADLNDATQVEQAVAGSGIVYLTAGLPYRLSTWQQQWPSIMAHVIAACKKHHARLIFFDNIYVYGKVRGPITEDCPIQPASKKGMVRLHLCQMLNEALNKGEISGAIVRAADFYGPGAKNAVINVLALDKLKQHKNAQWLCNDRVRYSMTYTPDAAKGTALVGNTPEAMNQVWHLPTSGETVTAEELITLSAEIAGTSAKHTLLKKWMLQLAGLFDGTIRELVEMTYQYQNDYIFDSSKFEKHFNFKPTSYRDGLNESLRR